MKVFPSTKSEYLRLTILVILVLTVTGYLYSLTRSPCQFPNSAFDRDFDFRVQLGTLSYQGNTGNLLDFLVHQLIGSSRVSGPFDFTVDLYGKTYQGRADNLIDSEIFRFGSFETHLLYFLRDVMRGVAPDGGVFVDVGANTGQHSLFMSDFCSQVYAIEPYEPVLVRLRDHISRNRIDNVTILPVALGAENTKATFHQPPDYNLGIGSFVEGFWPESSGVETMEVVTGDSIFSAVERVSVDVMKIDVEGYERYVLEGLKKTLNDLRPIIVMEISLYQENAFSDEEELLSAFPGDYEILLLSKPDCCWCKGEYSLQEPWDGFFEPSTYQADIVLYPREREDQVPLGNPQ
jgi:FkbM family methyltransferase